MPVISLSAQDVGVDQDQHHLPSLLSAEKVQNTDASPSTHDGEKQQDEPGRQSIPTPISPIPESPRDITVSSATGTGTPPTNRPIPPPPTPRRHRSGILMSRVRAHTGGNTFNSSKSFGDLSESALGMSDMTMSMSEAGPSTSRFGGGQDGKRIASEGDRKQVYGEQDDEDDMWDNSARFYHRIHSRSASRAGSRVPSPAQSPPVQTHPLSGQQTPGSPIYVRRNMTVPHGLGPPSATLSASLSPNHHFLQQHLPPTFPQSPETTLSDPPNHMQHHGINHSMVILTPTTQEWRELKGMETGRVDQDELPSSDSSDNSDNDDDDSSGRLRRTVSIGSEGIPSSSSSMLIRTEAPSVRPALYQTRSVDVLEKEARHTPDPGASESTPAKNAQAPTFSSNIIAPSPSGLQEEADGEADGDMLSFKPRAKRRSLLEFDENGPLPDLATDEEGDSSPTQDDNPARFASIGRRDSLRVTRKAGAGDAPRPKSKRELEREKLFKMVDEELEDHESDERHRYSVTEIGRGGLGTSPTQEEPPRVVTGSNSLPAPSSAAVPGPRPAKSASAPVSPPPATKVTSPTSPTRKVALSPTQPMRPSPLHASPMTAVNGLPPASTPSPVETPVVENPPNRPILPAPENTDEKLDVMRDYAKALASHHSQQSLVRDTSSDPKSSPPRGVGSGPRSPRKRDTTRQSLVAGRIVQPYSATPAANLPERPGMFRQPSSLQSFSPFRSPQLGASKGTPGGLMPHLSRLDSTISIAPSTGVPSECGTPNSETAGGMGGHGIQDYVIVQEAGKGAYGLVMRARVKGPKGDPVGDEVIIKYIIKARILADCWKKHKKLGPIPVELHVMDQLRHLMYNPPAKPHPWDPARNDPKTSGSVAMSKRTKSSDSGSVSSGNDEAMSASMEKNLSYELEMVLNRGHPNIVKLLDFFEDREFYYLVMPRYGTGLDLFDRIERSPDGLQSFEIRSLLGQLADAVRFLHANGIVHRDIKDENVILDGEGRCQLIDFGSAAHWRPGKKWDTFSGTMHYASPEIVRGEHYGGKEQDVYALGVVAYVLLIGEPPFSVLPDEALAGLVPDGPASEALTKRCDDTPQQADQGKEPDGGGRLGDVADLVRQCMQFELADRPTADAMCRHRYLVGDGGWTGYKGWINALPPSGAS